jgi:hypothetical protein
MTKLPWYVLFGFIGTTVIAAFAAMLSGWRPHQELSRIVMPLYFGGFLAMLTVAYGISGNTLFHDARTGTIQRATSPGLFRAVLWGQLALSLALLALGTARWLTLRG